MGFNIDLMGDDIDRILASSKNQEELCRLLGIENTGRGKIEEIGCRKDGKNLGSFYNNNNNNNNNNIGNNYNTTNTPNRPNSSTPKNNLPQNEINSVPLISVSHPS
jgi:reverse gyrase